jgi:ribonucleoside-triphosphate reductase (thioredoxin)
MLKSIRKRNGSEVPFDGDRLERAITAALQDSGDTNYEVVRAAKLHVLAALALRPNVSAEEIQDEVERALMWLGEHDAAKAYILHRQQKLDRVPKEYGDSGISDYIVLSKYSRYLPEQGRRELWSESATRVMDMHRDFFSTKLTRPVAMPRMGQRSLRDIFSALETAVQKKDVLPSMRSMQFGGNAILQNEMRLYNCIASHIDTPRRFAEAMWLLLCGCGVGFSVQKQHVAQIPAFPVRENEDDLTIIHYRVEDSIEGWANAVQALIDSHYNGTYVEFDFSAIRPKGAVLQTSGGRAPGHLPLKKCLAKMRDLLRKVSGRHLRPIEAYDMLMFCAGAVISGGIRRSATLALFSADDEEMTNAKTGEWWKQNPQRQHSNNSATLDRATVTRESFGQLFDAVKQFGEPGFYFTGNVEYVTNPCVEIGLNPVLTVDTWAQKRLQALGMTVPLGEKLVGWQACNLTSINGARCTSAEEFYRLCELASALGTLQAAYTDTSYLGPVSRVLLEREALLGVSICGILENPDVLLVPEILSKGASIVRATNAAVAAAIEIRAAARTTCVKPDGTTSLVLDTGSGIHPRHARKYFRRVQAARTEPVFQFFKSLNPQMVEPYVMKAETTEVITFPVSAGPKAVVKDDLTALEFLEMVKTVQQHWVRAGTAHDVNSPLLEHNVSNTVTVKATEWEEVEAYLWENRDSFTGVSILPSSGDKDYMQAPHEEVVTLEDVRKWNALHPVFVDYSKMYEATDATELQDTVACGAQGCEVL